MIKAVLGGLGLVVVVGLIAVTVPTTLKLAQIDKGLNRSLDATNQLVQIETTIVHKNQSLKDVVQIAADMNSHLDITEGATSQIDQNIRLIDALNAQTLELNQGMRTFTVASGNNLGDIRNGMGQLLHATQGLDHTLQRLNDTLAQDAQNVGQMRTSTHNMNQKVPGVLQ